MARDPATDDTDDRLRAIRALVLDVDGVLTDGAIVIDDHGVESKHFHVRDGAGIALWRKSGGLVAIVSGRRAAVVDRRAAELGITPVVQGASQKLAPFLDVVRTLGLEPHQAAFMGDDLADLAPMAAAGLAACPSDAAPEVRQAAHFVAPSPGGRGAVRELVEALLRSQHAWEAAVQAIQSA